MSEILYDQKLCPLYVGNTCSEIDKAYQKGRADALSIDMEKPMHFTDEQKAWIKNYIIINAKRQRSDAIKEYKNKLIERLIPHIEQLSIAKDSETYLAIIEIAEQLKENNS